MICRVSNQELFNTLVDCGINRIEVWQSLGLPFRDAFQAWEQQTDSGSKVKVAVCKHFQATHTTWLAAKH